jgi:hypothetical protein
VQQVKRRAGDLGAIVAEDAVAEHRGVVRPAKVLDGYAGAAWAGVIADHLDALDGRTLRKTLGLKSRTSGLTGYGPGAKDYHFRIERRKVGVKMCIAGDPQLSHASLWSIRGGPAVEPFIDVASDSGTE